MPVSTLRKIYVQVYSAKTLTVLLDWTVKAICWADAVTQLLEQLQRCILWRGLKLLRVFLFREILPNKNSEENENIKSTVGEMKSYILFSYVIGTINIHLIKTNIVLY